MKERNHCFDLLCGLCIIRMIMLHVISSCGLRGEFWFGKLMAWTFYFICFFFFKAGYFNKGVEGATLPFLKDKAKRLLIPYVAWGAIGNAVYFGFLYFFQKELHAYIDKLTWSHVWVMSHFFGNPPVWFLFSFFCTYVVVHLLQKVPYASLAALAFPAVSWWLAHNDVVVYMSLSNVFMGVFFFYLGHWWHRLQETVQQDVFVLLSGLLLTVFVFGNHFWHGEYDMSLNAWVHSPWGAVLNTALALCGLSGMLMTLLKHRVPVVGYIGEHSMVYFVAHYPIIYYYKLVHTVAGRSMWHRWDDFILVMMIVLIVCTYLVPYVEKVPWLSGRWPKHIKLNEG